MGKNTVNIPLLKIKKLPVIMTPFMTPMPQHLDWNTADGHYTFKFVNGKTVATLNTECQSPTWKHVSPEYITTCSATSDTQYTYTGNYAVGYNNQYSYSYITPTVTGTGNK